MQNEFWGETVEDVFGQLAWDIETKRSGRQNSKSRECERRRQHIYDLLNQMQKISREIASVSASTKRDIKRAQRSTRDAKLGLMLDAASLVIPLGFTIRSFRTLANAISAAQRTIAKSQTRGGAILTAIEVRDFLSSVDTVSGRLSTIRNNQKLVSAGRRLSRLNLSLHRLDKRLKRSISAYNSSGC